MIDPILRKINADTKQHKKNQKILLENGRIILNKKTGLLFAYRVDVF